MKILTGQCPPGQAIQVALKSISSRHVIAVCFSCAELINTIGLSGLHTTLRVPPRREPEGP